MMSGKVLLGVAAGLVAGAAIGILFAPESGEETRKKLMKRATDYAADLKDRIGEWAQNSLLQFEPAAGVSKQLTRSQQAKLEDMQTA